jgi:hypothetical protein
MPRGSVAVSLARGEKLSGSKTQVMGALAVPEVSGGGGPCAERWLRRCLRSRSPASSKFAVWACLASFSANCAS